VTQRPESDGGRYAVGPTKVVAGKVDVLPAERCKMVQQGVWHRLAVAAHGVERAAEINGVPQRYGGCDQGELAGAVLLRFDGPVAQLAEAMEADRMPLGLGLIRLSVLSPCSAIE
jgi:hypothetical protein